MNRLPVAHRAQIAAAMRDVRDFGLPAARHLLGEIFEVRADAGEVIYRILFATEGLGSQILLSLEAFTRKTRRTPPGKIDLAERRLADWRRRGRSDQK